MWISGPENSDKLSPSDIMNLDHFIGPQNLVNNVIYPQKSHIFLSYDRDFLFGWFSLVLIFNYFSLPGFVCITFISELILLQLQIFKIDQFVHKIPVEHWPYCTII